MYGKGLSEPFGPVSGPQPLQILANIEAKLANIEKLKKSRESAGNLTCSESVKVKLLPLTQFAGCGRCNEEFEDSISL